MATLKVLITGATGYIGGTVLSTLLNSSHESLKNAKFSALVRGEHQAKVMREHDVEPILFQSLEETDLLARVAQEYDAIIHTASGFHSASARALILGLGQRAKETGKDVYYIHTSGTSNLGDRPITGRYHESRTFSDKDDIYSYEKEREAIEAYAQRTTDLVAVQTGLEAGVKTYIIMSPTIYGIGTGFFNNQSIQLPIMMRTAVDAGQAQVIKSGDATWDHVHIHDLALLYELILAKVIAHEELPYGPKGIFFSGTGVHTWAELSQGIASAGHSLGALQTDQVRKISLEEAAQIWSGGDAFVCELGFASNSRTRSDLSREIGWKPTKTEEDWQRNFHKDFAAVLQKKKDTSRQ